MGVGQELEVLANALGDLRVHTREGLEVPAGDALTSVHLAVVLAAEAVLDRRGEADVPRDEAYGSLLLAEVPPTVADTPADGAGAVEWFGTRGVKVLPP